jgi:hypothetical protein
MFLVRFANIFFQIFFNKSIWQFAPNWDWVFLFAKRVNDIWHAELGMPNGIWLTHQIASLDRWERTA